MVKKANKMKKVKKVTEEMQKMMNNAIKMMTSY